VCKKKVAIGPLSRAPQSILNRYIFNKGGAIMQAATVAKVTLMILIAVLVLMIRNVFAIEPQVWSWVAQCAESASNIAPGFPC
jgi:hypothetical protein